MASSKYAKKLFELLSSERRDVISIYLYALFGGVVYLCVPLGIQSILSYAFGATMVTSIYLLIGIVTIATFLTGFFQLRVMQISETLQQKIFVDYAIRFAEKLPKVDLAYANQYNLSELANRFFDAPNLQKSFSKVLLELPVAIIQFIFGMLLLCFYHPYFIGFSILVSLGVYGVFRYTRDSGISTSIEESDEKYEVAAWLEDIARDIKSFKSSAFLQAHIDETDKKINHYLENRTSHFKILLFQYKTVIFFKVIITLAMLVLGCYLLIDQKINIGAFVATEIIVLTLMTSVEKIIKSLEEYYNIITSFAKLHKVLDLKEEKSGTLIPTEFTSGHSLELKEVQFGFEGSKPIILNGNASIKPNTITLIYGKQGSGKSVLFNLIMGLYEPTEGLISMNGNPLSGYDKTALRKNVGVYTEDMDLIKSTILENIKLGDETITVDIINQLFLDLGLDDAGVLFQNGLLTEVQASDKRLSFTKKKIILMVRALAHSNQLVLLEDPTAGFSKEVSENILNYLKQLSQKCTIILIGKKSIYETIADQILELKDGHLNKLK